MSLTLLLPWLVVAIQQIIEGDASISFIRPAAYTDSDVSVDKLSFG